jgi:hypothetical protein
MLHGQTRGLAASRRLIGWWPLQKNTRKKDSTPRHPKRRIAPDDQLAARLSKRRCCHRPPPPPHTHTNIQRGLETGQARGQNPTKSASLLSLGPATPSLVRNEEALPRCVCGGVEEKVTRILTALYSSSLRLTRLAVLRVSQLCSPSRRGGARFSLCATSRPPGEISTPGARVQPETTAK